MRISNAWFIVAHLTPRHYDDGSVLLCRRGIQVSREIFPVKSCRHDAKLWYTRDSVVCGLFGWVSRNGIGVRSDLAYVRMSGGPNRRIREQEGFVTKVI